jgi:carboxymethylenebutenolidase
MVDLPAPRGPIRAEWVTLAVDAGAGALKGDMPAWWACPAEGEPRGAVLVLPEVFGVNAWVRSVADRLAGEGFAALAISTFWRTAPGLELGYDAEGLAVGREHRDQVRADQLLVDAATAAAWLQQRHGVDRLGCVGFCFGGHLALIAATLPCFAATCDFYGARVASFRPGGGAPSLELVEGIPGRLWCFCGGADPLLPPEEIAAIEAALTAANGGRPARESGGRHLLIVAPGAGHGYLCEARADFNPEAARQGWIAMLELFAATLTTR